MMKRQRITKIITFHPEEDINVCSKFHGYQSNSCQDISVKAKPAKPAGGARRKVKGSPAFVVFIVWGP